MFLAPQVLLPTDCNPPTQQLGPMLYQCCCFPLDADPSLHWGCCELEVCLILPSRHMIRNSSPGDLKPSALQLGHIAYPQYRISTNERGVKILFLSNVRIKVTLKGWVVHNLSHIDLSISPPLANNYLL